MPIDPSIALSVKGLELQDPLAQYGRMAAIQQAQNQNALAQYQLGAAQRDEAKDIARTNALAQAGGDETAIANALLKAGDLAGYTSFLKSSREANKANIDLVDAKLKQSRGFLETLDPKTPGAAEAYIAWHEANHKDPVLGPVLAARGITAEQSRERIVQALQTPGGLAQLINQSKLGAEKFMEMNKAQLSTKDIGGAVVDRTFEPLTGKVTEISRVQKTATPGDVMADARARAQMAQQERHFQATPTVTQIVDPTDPNKMLSIDARRYQGGGVGSPGVIGVTGKEPGAALRQNKIETGKTQLADDLDNLRASFQKLDEMRAIPSTERGGISNIGSATAASSIGQMFGRAVGTEAQVERDVINSARMRLINSIKNATGMSAQQLNSNMELQSMLRSISDPGQSVQAAMRIIDDIENAYVKGSGKLPKRRDSVTHSAERREIAPGVFVTEKP